MNNGKMTAPETTATFRSFTIWDKLRTCEYFNGIKLSKYSVVSADSGVKNDEDLTSVPYDGDLINDFTIATKMSCSSCNSKFNSREEQILHFKSDYHCENLKRRERGLSPIKHSPVSDEDDDNSNDEDFPDSESSSNSEEEVDPELPVSDSSRDYLRQPKIFYENVNGDIFSLYKCLLFSQKEDALTTERLYERTNKLIDLSKWTVLLLSQGHFAGAVFKENDILLKKTFHRYVVRAKQGSSQSVHDSHAKHAKSAGANLRRHNEIVLIQEVQTLLRTWSEDLADCSHIFYRAPGSQKNVLFGGKLPIFEKNDLRLRNIPFPTKRPKHNEVVRVKNKLATVELNGKTSDWKDHERISDKKAMESVLNRPNNDFDSAQNEVTLIRYIEKDAKIYSDAVVPEGFKKPKEKCRKKTRQVTPQISRNPSSGEEDFGDDLILDCQEELHSTSDLKMFEVTKPPKVDKLKPKRETSRITGKKHVASILDKDGQKLHSTLYTACKINDVENVEKLLSPFIEIADSELSSQKLEEIGVNSNMCNLESRRLILLQVLNLPFGSNRSTLLHTVSRCGYTKLLRLLLENGADPALKDHSNLTPYSVAVNKQTRNTFRRFMADFPERYDYTLAQIPSALSEDVERTRASKLQEKRQAKRQKAKLTKQEDVDKQNFLKLSDAEKKMRAITARCYLCADSLTGKVPFEYSDMKFCTMNCLKLHKQTRR